MSLETRLNKVTFTGNGVTTVFPFSFKVWKTDQVKVYVGGDSTATDVTSSCTIAINGTSGGTVTFGTAPASGVTIAVCREMPFVQEDRYISGTRFDPHEVEDRFDQDCAERQELRDGVTRSIKVPVTSSKTGEEFYAEFLDEVTGVKEGAEYIRRYVQDIPVIKSSLAEVAAESRDGLFWVPGAANQFDESGMFGDKEVIATGETESRKLSDWCADIKQLLSRVEALEGSEDA